jgi:hypothetical protein
MMHPLPGECPICGGEMFITRLECRECEVSMEGRFFAGPFSQLTPEQMAFIELFVKNEGKITHMESELGLSYPTIRNRLHEIIRTMGYEPGKEDSSKLSEDDRRRILEELNEGKITSEEAMKMLKDT